ncbi:hypothetical protein F4821DRAFT_277151 [Hypoxylon rubiginosum]|uniref:Uncharacterized protein n=1 Tax=Hypoxylon rubiginosum TaxID=110542 RepID=A0ACC0D6V6_9PEZI|nr:hypothetical protein F4821DRAFT_277151 [Hypoxylon rubiginosum]
MPESPSRFVERSRFERRAELARFARDHHADVSVVLGLSWLFNGAQAHVDYVGGLDTNKILTRLTKLVKSVPWDVAWKSVEPTTKKERVLPSLKDALVDVAPVESYQKETARQRRKRRHQNYRDFAGILAQVDTVAIASFALDIFQARHEKVHDYSLPPLPYPRISGPSFGTAHVFYIIEFYDGAKWIIKIPANGTPDVWDKLCAEAMRTEALTLNLLKTQTSMPVPEIIDADSSPHNDIHVPYLIMEYIEGRTLDHIWFGQSGDDEKTIKERRTKVMSGLAKAMLQLGGFEFERGGAPVFDGEGYLVDVGPLRELDVQAMVDRWLDNEDCERGPLYTSIGPFQDAAEMQTALLDLYPCDAEPCVGADRLLRLLLGLVREPTGSRRRGGKEMERKKRDFVLTHPGLSMRNVIVEEDGTLKGIVGWDGVRAAPKSVGNEALPRWLVRDFNPFVWRWQPPPEFWRMKSSSGDEEAPEGSNKLEDAPWVLRELRDEYVKIMRSLKKEKGSYGEADVDVTKQSLLALSLDAAARDPRCKSAVLRRILDKCSRASEVFDFGRIVESLEDGGQLDGYKRRCLEKNLQELIDRGYVRGAVVW